MRINVTKIIFAMFDYLGCIFIKNFEMHFNKDLFMTGVNIVWKLATCPTYNHQSLQMGLFFF